MSIKPCLSSSPQLSVVARVIRKSLVLLAATVILGCGTTLDERSAPGSASIRPAGAGSRGIDYSWSHPGGAAIKAAGFEFAARYLSHDRSGKTIEQAEVDDLHNNGVSIVLVWEEGAQNALGGNGQGVADAETALTQADALGFPGNLPIYFAVDFDATPEQQGPIDDYLRGAASVIGAARVGVYGGYYVVKRCFENGTAVYGWQTLAWSGGQVLDGAHLYQNGGQAFGGGSDIDEALKDDYGAWSAAPPPPPPTGCGILGPGKGLDAGQALGSCDGRFTLAMQADGNLVLYQNGVGALWASNTWHPTESTGYTAVMQDDGNFVLYENGAQALWDSGTPGHPGSYLAIQDDGNVVVYAAGGTPLWVSNTCCR